MYRNAEERVKFTPQTTKWPPVHPDHLDSLTAAERAAGYELSNGLHGTNLDQI